MAPDVEYWHVPQSKESSASKLYRNLDPESRSLLHDMYVNGKMQTGSAADVLYDAVLELGQDGQAEIEALAADEFGPPMMASKGEMYRRDSHQGKPREKRQREKRIGKGKYEIKM